jgi:hypothetical protein
MLSEMQFCLERREAPADTESRRASRRPVPWKPIALVFAAVAAIELVLLLKIFAAR